MQPNCPLCFPSDEHIIFANDIFRIVHVHDEFYPAYFRIILNKHAAEMTDINEQDAHKIFKALLVIENQIRKILNPDKINLASLGNVVPHLHWHIIARYKNDRHFPNPIWGNVTHTDYHVSNSLLDLEQKLISSLMNDEIILI